MPKLTDQDKQKLIELIEADRPLPSVYKTKLFGADDVEFIEATKECKLQYKGKARKEDVLANTPAAPFQKIRSFNSDKSFDDGWRNMLIFGDNLLALKTLYDDQRGDNIYKTRNRIKLIYIDPPFATRQDFMKDREKAYRDKIIGTQFIEFLRKRLILMREILADDGAIYVHLDQKKGHYIKIVLDEIFGEQNFQNDISWKRTPFSGSSKARSNKFPVNHDSIFFYAKSDNYCFIQQYQEYSDKYKSRFKYQDEVGYYRKTLLKTYSKETESKLKADGRFIPPEQPGAYPSYKQYLHESKGRQIEDIWTDLNLTNPMATERLNYPTQKPEILIERIIQASGNDGIVLDAFCGSGTTLSVAEKLNYRWVGMDCGKLSIYTSQRRMLNLHSQIGSKMADQRREHERTDDFENHSKSKSRGLFMVYDKARKGDLNITDQLLNDLAEFAQKHIGGKITESISLVCPQNKFKIRELTAEENEDGNAGEKIITIGRIKFLISFIQAKEKPEKTAPLKAKEFALYHAGIYDQKQILDMDWQEYRPFVMKLFGVREHEHKIYCQRVDGYIGVHPAMIWDYPNHPDAVLDEEYVQSLHSVMGGKAGDRCYVVAPVVSMGFMEDEVRISGTTYVFLKVPLSVLKALIEKGEPGSLKQPVKEDAVNEVMDAIGFDFISQPVVEAEYRLKIPEDPNVFNSGKNQYTIEVTTFKSDTLAYDPDDFENFETFSMVMIDRNYNGDYFSLTDVFWSDQILNQERNKAVILIPETDFTGERMMIIFMDKYGNELKVTKEKADFI